MQNSVSIDVHEAYSQFINQFAIILRTAHIHSTENIAFISAAQRFRDILDDIIAADGIEVQLRGDFFYVEDERIRFSPRYMLNYDYLSDEFRKVELGTVHFKRSLDLQDIKWFIHALVECDFMRKTFEFLEEKMSGSDAIEIRRLEEVATEENGDPRKIVRKTYFKSVSYVKSVMNRLKQGEGVDMRRAKRVVTSIVNTIVEQEQMLLGMTSIKDYDEYTYYHCTNVSILGVALGQKLGIDRLLLVDLGIAGLFHDIGKIEVPYGILNKPSTLEESEWRIMKKHPVWGVKALLKMRDIDGLSIRAALTAFEHHMNMNHSGYPSVRNKSELDMFSRIISIADRYDAMTAARVYARTSMTPDKALGILVESSGTQLDPVMVKVFVNMLGLYPIGTVVRLDTNELAIVFENNPEDLYRPRIMLITDNTGRAIEGTVVDLDEKNDYGLFRRNILHTIDPKKYGMSIAEYLL